MPGQMNKQNARQNKKREASYARYENTARREQNKIRKILRHLRNYKFSVAFNGKNALALVGIEDRDPKNMIGKAWDACVLKVGIGPTKNIMAEFGRTPF